MGSAHEFETCACHRLEKEPLETANGGMPLRWSNWPKEDFEALGLEDLEDELVISALPHEGFDPDSFSMKGATPSVLLEDGDVLDLGDRSFEILHLPGHSPGSIALWEKRSGTLFSGDVIYDAPLLDQLKDSNIENYVASMERLLTLPVSVVHAGHAPSFDGERLRAIAQDYLRRNSA